MSVKAEEINVVFSATNPSSTQDNTLETRIELEPISHLLRRTASVEAFIRKAVKPTFEGEVLDYEKTETDITGKKVTYTLHYTRGDVLHLIFVSVEEA